MIDNPFADDETDSLDLHDLRRVIAKLMNRVEDLEAKVVKLEDEVESAREEAREAYNRTYQSSNP